MAIRENTRKRVGLIVSLIIVLAILIIYLIPIYWVVVSSIKPMTEVQAIPPKLWGFKPTIYSYVRTFTDRMILPPGEKIPPPEELAKLHWWERMSYVDGNMKVLKVSGLPSRLLNSVIIGIISTILAVTLGTLTAYGFSRFKVAGEGDWLFFILSTRMLPAVVVIIPLYLMFRTLKLADTHLGLILLYTCFNVSFAVWLMKGFIDEIPREYEEAALVDGYTRFEAFRKIVIPQAATGIAATVVFCFITAWNEYAFALIMTTKRAETAPPFIPSQIGVGGVDWGAIAASTLMFLLPVVILTIFLRRHLLRGITFGAIRK